MHDAFVYHPEKGLKVDPSTEVIAQALQDDRSLVWVDILDMDDPDIDLLTSTFNLHPLTVEDFVMPNARPKIEKFNDYIFMVIFALEASCVEDRGRAKAAELDFCLGKNFLITVHNCALASTEASKERVKKQSPMIMHGADMLLCGILDACVESYFPVVQQYDKFADEICDELFKKPNPDILKRIFHLKNEIMYLRRTIGPQEEILSRISCGEFDLIQPSNIVFFRNIYDNLVRTNDIIGASRDVITGAMEAYASLVSNRLNEVMKTLTILATIMMPLTLIASIYGMNFKHMPELDNIYGYPTVIFVMVIISVTMIVYFRRKRWL